MTATERVDLDGKAIMVVRCDLDPAEAEKIAVQLVEVTGLPVVLLRRGDDLTALDDAELARLGLYRVEREHIDDLTGDCSCGQRTGRRDALGGFQCSRCQLDARMRP